MKKHSKSNKIPAGPLDDMPAPETLQARVVTTSDNPAIHGYNMYHDLVKHYSFTEMIYLSLKGELPNKESGHAFEIALKFLFPISISEAPSHAGVVGKICTGQPSAVMGMTAITLIDMARQCIEDHQKLLVWLYSPTDELPKSFRAKEENTRKIVLELKNHLAQTQFSCDIFKHDPNLISALIAVLYACGLQVPEQIQAAIVFAKYPCAIAEGFAVPAFSLFEYPLRLPNYQYKDSYEK